MGEPNKTAEVIDLSVWREASYRERENAGGRYLDSLRKSRPPYEAFGLRDNDWHPCGASVENDF